MLDILDNRSAIYSKMGKYDLALRDARHMVKINNLDGRVCILPKPRGTTFSA